MGRTFLLTAACTVAMMATSVAAQNAIRCEINGKVVYSDTACAPGGAARAITPTQETAEQKAVGRAAGEQIRKDTAYVDKRLDDRYKRETTRPAVLDLRAKDKTEVDANAKPKRSAVKAKKSKKTSKKATSKKASKQDNKSYRSTPAP